MTQQLAPPMVLGGDPAFKEELRKALLHQWREHHLTQTEETATGMPQGQAAAMYEQRDTLILSYLDYVDSLLRKYAVSAHLDYEDLRQDASLIIMHCIDLKPEQQYRLHGYVVTSVRNRIMSKIAYTKRREAESLDAPASREASNESIGDLLPSGYSVDPLLVVLEKEERLHARRQAKEAIQSLPVRRRKTKRVQKAIALFQEEVAVR